MRNVTLSVEDDVLRAARRYAAERETSVNGLVREFLRDLAAREDRARQARQQIRRLARRSRAELGPKAWTRDDLHAR
jgi:hypothetical protein